MSDEQIGAAIRAAASTVEAPQRLRERLAAAPAPRRRRARRPVFGAAAAALATALTALVLLVSGGGLTVQDVAAAALRPPTGPASAHYQPAGWTAIGARTDRLDGRTARTVVYRRADGRHAHYAILGGTPIDRPSGRTVIQDGRRYTLLRDGSTAIVAWQQGGHTCVLASRSIDAPGLLALLRT